jgi:hypothetical protein
VVSSPPAAKETRAISRGIESRFKFPFLCLNASFSAVQIAAIQSGALSRYVFSNRMEMSFLGGETSDKGLSYNF